MDAAEKAAETLSKMQSQAGEVFKGYMAFTKKIGEFGPIDHKTQELIMMPPGRRRHCFSYSTATLTP